MDYQVEVENVLRALTAQLKGLAEAALADGDFDSVIYVTTILKRFTHLQLGPATESEASSAEDSEALFPVASDPARPVSRRPAARPKSKASYPRFRREGSYLVKVGWSKKSRQEYEHRALVDVALAVVACLDDKTTGGRTVSADELAPSTDGGQEIPNYQLYLALAWLRSEHLLNRIGRKGYTSAVPGELALKARERWEEMSA